MNGVYWRHNDQQRWWELIVDEFPGEWEPRMLAYVTDEELAHSGLSTAGLQALVTRRFKVPLPDEAFAR